MKRTFISTHVEAASTVSVVVAAAAFTAVAVALSLAGAIMGVAAFWPVSRSHPTVVTPGAPAPAASVR